MCEPKPLSSVATIIRPPLRKMTGADLQLLGDLRGALTRAQPPYRRELDLPVENSSFCCGHLPFLGTVFPVFVSHFRGALHFGACINPRPVPPAQGPGSPPSPSGQGYRI